MLATGRSAVLLSLILAGSATAQITITDVVNAGSRIRSGQQSSGIAQGALFAITGKGVGPDQPQQASFPLPTTDGLGGVTVQATVGGLTVDAILVYVSANAVDAILPSNTPLGAGTVTLNNNGVTATKAITVVAAAFGIFTQTPTTGAAQALAFNVNPDGSTSLNTTTQSVQPGQDVMLNGTGLGAIPSDETQSGVVDVPTATIQVYAGVVPATVVSAGRGLCCDGLDPNYPVPPGIAAWDVIRFTIPDGVTGCFIPVVVQIGGLISNLATISIDPSGGACAPAVSTLPADLVQQLAGQTGISLGALGLGRGSGSVVTKGAVRTTKQDTGSATFVKYANVPASMFTGEVIFPANVCNINGYPGPNGTVIMNGNQVTIVPLKAVSLDAGPAITVTGPSGTRTIPRQTAGMVVDYSAKPFGASTPGNYYDPGHYTVTGPGGKDVGAFSASTDVPSTPFVWTNVPDITVPLDRSQDLTITWTGGVPGTQVTVLGGSLVNGVNTGFLCAAPVIAGHFTVPSYVLLNLPPTGSSTAPGQLTVGNRSVSTFSAPGLDLATIAWAVDYTLYLKFQ